MAKVFSDISKQSHITNIVMPIRLFQYDENSRRSVRRRVRIIYFTEVCLGVGSTPPAGVVGASIQHYSVARALIRRHLDILLFLYVRSHFEVCHGVKLKIVDSTASPFRIRGD